MSETPAPTEGVFWCIEAGDDDDDGQHAAEVYGPFEDRDAAVTWASATLRPDETCVVVMVLPPALYAEQRRLDADGDDDDDE